MPEALKVQENSPAVEAMMEDWNTICALQGGTRAMRDANMLPQRKLEHDEDYTVRKKTATLYPAFSETVQKLTGRVFSKPLQLGDDVPDVLSNEDTGILMNVDKQGRNIQAFARNTFSRGLSRGHVVVIVDAPTPTAVVKTVADEKAQNMRPYWIEVDPMRILGWKQDAQNRLIQLRVWFDEEQDDGGLFGTVCIKIVKVYNLMQNAEGNNQVRVDSYYPTKGDEKEYQLDVNKTVFIDMDEIPVRIYYTHRTGFLCSRPPLVELAYLNVKHYQKQSHTDTLIDVAQIPILLALGGDPDAKITIGAKMAIRMGQDDDLKFVEHTGSAIKTGQDALAEIKSQMRDAGAKLLQPGTGTGTNASNGSNSNKTATEITEEAAAENSALGTMCEDFEDFLAQLLALTMKFTGADNKMGGTVELQPNLEPEMDPLDSATFLLNMANAGKLSDETLFNEAQRRGFVSDDTDWDEEQQRIMDQPSSNIMPPPRTRPGATGATGTGATGPGATGATGATGTAKPPGPTGA